MVQHTNAASQDLVSFLQQLGRSLGYVAQAEKPLAGSQAAPQSIDVAWATDDNHPFPLMIFEIESAKSASAANNPVKVFGKATTLYEKPLFFFHIFLESEGDSARIKDLLGAFGHFNYRTYAIPDLGLDRVIRDILSQHRRISRRVDIPSLVGCLERSPLPVDVHNILAFCETLEFNRLDGSLIPAYCSIAVQSSTYQEDLIRLLERRQLEQRWNHEPAYFDSYIGEYWQTPIGLGILASGSAKIQATDCWRAFVGWNEATAFRDRLAPAFGLNQDYDMFQESCCIPLTVLLAALFREAPGAVAYLAARARALVEHMDGAGFSRESILINCAWLLHLGVSRTGVTGLMAFAAGRIAAAGGLPAPILLHPPVALPYNDERLDEELARVQRLGLEEEPAEIVPGDLVTLILGQRLEGDERRHAVLDLAARTLLAEDPSGNWEQQLVSVL